MPVGYYLSKLLDVIPVKLEDLNLEFLQYDTRIKDEEFYKLPTKGDYMILMLRSTAIRNDDGELMEASQLWTTIRRRTPEKEKYYRELVG
jgi:hypothetical protein